MKNFIEVDSRLTDLELVWDKIAVICNNVKDDYFSETEPDDWFLKAYYNESGVKVQILLDYLYMMKESIKVLRELLDEELHRKNEEAA